MEIAVLLTIGKYLFLVCLYVFVLSVFRGMMRQLAAESGARARTWAEPAGSMVSRGTEVRTAASAPAARLSTSPVAEMSSEREGAQGGTARLIVIKAGEGDPAPGAELPLSAAVTIGRDDENSITLNDRYASGLHLLICLREGRRILVDRGSTNGTLVNGERVDSEVELKDGDRICVGRTVLEYRAA